jgi:transcription elongation factor GreA
MPKDILLTEEGLEKIKTELKKLKDVDRKEVIARIKTAKEFGDLSENSEYDEAKNEQAFIEGRIQELETMLKHAKIVDGKSSKGAITLGSTVEVEIEGDKETFYVVGPTESDPLQGKISSESPVGQALMGKVKGNSVQVQTPDGTTEYKILEVK